jgi:hypothetical protein
MFIFKNKAPRLTPNQNEISRKKLFLLQAISCMKYSAILDKKARQPKGGTKI